MSFICTLFALERECMIKRLALIALVLLLPAACATTSGNHRIANDRDLLDNKSTRFFVKTIPIPERTDEIIVMKKAALETIHHISFSEFLRQVQPAIPPAHYYLMHYSRRIVTTDEANPQGDWIRPFFGNPFRYRYEGTVVVLKTEWNAFKAKERKKKEKEAKKAEKQLKKVSAAGSGQTIRTGPDGGKILQEDKDAMTEMLPSGAYVIHPAAELEKRGYAFDPTGHWVRESP
jgi:hypothetical protein